MYGGRDALQIFVTGFLVKEGRAIPSLKSFEIEGHSQEKNKNRSGLRNLRMKKYDDKN
jgi:hypothetical protein